MTEGGASDDEVAEMVRAVLLDPDLAEARSVYAKTASECLTNVAGWIAVDSFLGGGKVSDNDSPHNRGEAFAEFRAVATVICMAAELAESSVTMAAQKKHYAVAATVRQLIECEYLLVLFLDNLANAKQWREATPAELRAEFQPRHMRKRLGGRFTADEYGRHCDAGGHPNPTGVRLLEFLDPARQIWPFASAEVEIDLGLHLRRCWIAVDRLLERHHARYVNVRAEPRAYAEEAWTTWIAADPIAAEFAPP